MSAFLGPIHYWMFNKISLLEDRAMAVAGKLEKVGLAAQVKAKLDEYGPRLAGQDLAELVGGESIHNSLYGFITKVEVLEAELVALAGDKHYDEVRAEIHAHGKATGARLLAERGEKADKLDILYRYIADAHLEGMPCDPGAQVEQTNGTLRYTHIQCNHIPNWKYTSCPISRMCAIHNEWLQGFIAGLDGSVTYAVEKTIADGASSCAAVIAL